MHHDTPLLATVVAGLVFAFLLGAVAHRLRVSPLVGYLAAGVLIGPFTPGFVADAELASELAELGVILLMFGVGLHFSLRDLLAVRRIAVPGAVVQIGAATAMGAGLGLAMGWNLAAGIVFGLALSVASTVVLLRALQGDGLTETERGRIAIGWLIVEDLVMVLALVMIPAIASSLNGGSSAAAIGQALAGTVLKVIGFVALMLVVGRRAIPFALHWVVHTGSRELFRLAVLAVALGVAFGAAYVFNVSFALGAFFAGMILGETQLSRRAAEETLPLRDAFAVLFFVSVGMLFRPAVLWEQPAALLAALLIIVLGKSLAAWAIVRAFGYSNGTALTIAASLAQIGEFSFILAGLGVSTNLLPAAARDLILAGAVLSILVNPLVFRLFARRVDPSPENEARSENRETSTHLTHPRIVIGYGRVGTILASQLASNGHTFRIIEDQADRCLEAAERGLDVVHGNAALESVLRHAEVDQARSILIAVPEGFEAAVIAERAKRLNPEIHVIARAHSDEEACLLRQSGADQVVIGEEQLALRMLTDMEAMD